MVSIVAVLWVRHKYLSTVPRVLANRCSCRRDFQALISLQPSSNRDIRQISPTTNVIINTDIHESVVSQLKEKHHHTDCSRTSCRRVVAAAGFLAAYGSSVDDRIL